MSRTIVIGDIHGALKALDQLLFKIALQNHDRIIFLGDYVDRGIHGLEVNIFQMRKFECF